ncbi:MAG: histidine phosphatase family protein [Xanthobacteraceae bacterium]|nr:MAG: histidine phosphatase family protein [Xanthobacteraceae bacterium]
MRRLLLLRHAKTERESASGLDRDRRLDARGRGDVSDIGSYMARHRLVPELALVSPAARTRETWQLLASALTPATPRAEVVPELYTADSTQLLRITRTAHGEQPAILLMIAHNPGLHEFALALARSGNATACAALAYNLPTCGLVVIDFAVDEWAQVAFRSGHLERFVSPRLLRESTS